MGLRPTQDDEKRIGPATTLALPLPSPCHPDRSEAKRRDLRFYGPFLDMFFDGAKRFADLSQTEGFRAWSRRACPERSRGNPGNACWQMLLGAFRPQTTPKATAHIA